MTRLDGKWALVTGSSRGIGQQVAAGLARLGCGVIVHGRSRGNLDETLRLLEPLGVPVRAVSGELSSPEGVEQVIAETRALGVPVDVLYNNAAIQNAWRPVWDITREEWLHS
ncbi:MAG TPA: SDR family NAD(P)-dependent oxidoreductase, partial [Deinococcales bacterium]|nr:SDR family NAD(P)-dependent oxidoreductase [Deinococcales bacterium]